MKQGWEVKKLGDVCNLLNGSTPLKSNKLFWDNGSTPWFTIEDIRNQGRTINYTKQSVTEAAMSKLKLLPKDTVLLCCTASVGEYAITNIDLTTNQQFNGLVIKDKNALLPMYLYYFASTLKDKLMNISGKTTIDFVSLTKLSNIEIYYPESIQEQQQIVEVLDKAFADIDVIKANAEQNLKNTKELFDSYLQNIFSSSSNDWKSLTMKDVCSIKSKLIDPKKNEYQEMLHVGAGNIISKTGELINLQTAKEEALISGKFVFDESMVLYSKIRPYLMKMVNCSFKGLCSADIYPLYPKDEIITKDFLYYVLLTDDFTNYAIEGSARAGMPKVNRNHLFSYKFNLPPIQEQQKIIERLDNISKEVKLLDELYKKKIKDCDELKKSLLDKAFKGELV
jgi:type I restriction enzyme, S subunit